MSKKKNNSFIDIFASIAIGFMDMIKGIVRLLLKIFISFGLWLPGVYAVLGVILFYTCNFNPFDFSVYGVIYLSGGVACIVCCIIMCIRTIIVKPVKSIFTKKTKVDKIEDEWLDAEAESENQYAKMREMEAEISLSPPISEEFVDEEDEDIYDAEYLIEPKEESYENKTEREKASSLLFDYLPKKTRHRTQSVMVSEPKKEIPEIYFSTLNPGILVHEYKDRFELFKVVGDKSVSIGVEYK